MAVVQVERALVDVGAVKPVAVVACSRAIARVTACNVVARRERVARVYAERALVDVLAVGTVAGVALEASATKGTGKISASRLRVAVVVREGKSLAVAQSIGPHQVFLHPLKLEFTYAETKRSRNRWVKGTCFVGKTVATAMLRL